MNFKLLLALFTFQATAICNVYAHDFWLEAKPFYSKSGDNVDIEIIVGENMFGETIPNIPAKYTDFSYTLKNGRKKVSGEIARYPAGYIHVPEAGVYTIGYRSTELTVTLDAEKFTAYLKKEGLEKIISLREQNNQAHNKAKEVYSRYAKTIIKAGEDSQIDYSQQNFAYTLEITPLTNPYQLKSGETLPVKVTYLGRPLAGTLVTAFTKEVPMSQQSMRTDNKGIAQIKLDKTGHWLVKSVEMIPSKRGNADWESFWASITFELR